MKYIVHVNKRIRYVRVYTILKKTERSKTNFLAQLFQKLLAPKSGEQYSGGEVKKWT